ncbi:MAG TPA: cupin domain-containing protein [Burkholderiaceae bacterium]|nr:cupin domain-containing protein [Burkholderiaceae bacterium]
MDIQAPTALLGGLSPTQFMRRHWQKRPLLVRQALPGVRPPLARAALFDLAGADDVESRLVRRDDAGRWHLRRGPLPRRALPPLSSTGWTLLVQGLDLHVEAAHALLSRFAFVPAARLDDLMLSYASDGGGVGPHTDAYDVFLVQVAGRRRWRYGRVTHPRWRDDVPLRMLASFTPEEEHVLQAGDLLYLPPGWGHDGIAQGHDCMTASVGYRTPAADELARALLARLADTESDDPRGRVHYRDPRQGATTQAGAMPAALQAFAASALQRLLRQPGAIERALGEWITEPKPQVWFEAGAGDARGGVRLDRRTRMAYDERHVYMNGESWRAAGRDARLMRQLADARALQARDVRALSAGARGVLDEWIEAGWVRVAGAEAKGGHDAT